MKIVGIVGAAVLCLSLGCNDDRLTNLEQRMKQLEERTHQLEAERTKTSVEDATRRAKLEACVADANDDFQRNLERNGKKQRDGSFTVPVPTSEQMQRQRQGKIEECRVLYSK